ncbi:MAG: DnaJ domain-containing protein [Oscillospiraceae bacterium]|nr:DnaJ domain-containing protein [Oscillospiraceae bacterium]
MNHYEFFGISRDASDDEIKNAYKNMAKKYHPDVSEGCVDYAHEKMQQINAAYRVLSNDALREEYDYSLWLEERAQKNADYSNEFGDYNPRGSEEYKSPWQKYYDNASKKSKFKFPFDLNIFKPKTTSSEKARRIMTLVWAIRLTLPVLLLFFAVGYITNANYVANFLDRIYGRGTPAEVTKMFFDSIKEEDFERAMSLARSSQYDNHTQITRLISRISRVYAFERGGVPFGEILFSSTPNELRFKVLSTVRHGFSSAEVTIEVTSLNIENIFKLTEEKILEHLRTGARKMILMQAVDENNISLVPQIYSEYMSDIMKEIPAEYLSATIVLRFSRPVANWIISGADDIDALRSVLLGGFGEDADLSNYLQIDWLEVLKIV